MTVEATSFQEFAALVEGTFDRPFGSITASTRCEEVPGWDSLGHSVLLSRVSRRCAVALVEADAVMPATVGELHGRIVALRGNGG